MANKTEDAAKSISLAEFVGTREKCGPMIAAFRFGVSLHGHHHGVFYLPFGIGGHIVRDGDAYQANFMVWSACGASLDEAESLLYGLVREHRPKLLTKAAIDSLTENAARTKAEAEKAPQKPRVARA
jgi:hypothetical protein